MQGLIGGQGDHLLDAPFVCGKKSSVTAGGQKGKRACRWIIMTSGAGRRSRIRPEETKRLPAVDKRASPSSLHTLASLYVCFSIRLWQEQEKPFLGGAGGGGVKI